ncbi:hypothetical protein JHW43_002892 [Diplocarpon mali]|nr:hypothetical protein JHW43_002892 [Diplocarpon mali]
MPRTVAAVKQQQHTQRRPPAKESRRPPPPPAHLAVGEPRSRLAGTASCQHPASQTRRPSSQASFPGRRPPSPLSHSDSTRTLLKDTARATAPGGGAEDEEGGCEVGEETGPEEGVDPQEREEIEREINRKRREGEEEVVKKLGEEQKKVLKSDRKEQKAAGRVFWIASNEAETVDRMFKGEDGVESLESK